MTVRQRYFVALAAIGFCFAGPVQADLSVCNKTDTILLAAVGYPDDKVIKTQGWWKIYPGYCKTPVAEPLTKRKNYFLHVETDPNSTAKADTTSWGKLRYLCVKGADFQHDKKSCTGPGEKRVGFQVIRPRGKDDRTVFMDNPKRRYGSYHAATVASIQRLLNLSGYDVGKPDGILGPTTLETMRTFANERKICGLNFDQLFPALEQAARQKLGQAAAQ